MAPGRLLFSRLRLAAGGRAALLVIVAIAGGPAAATGWSDTPIVSRNMDVLRYGAAERPRSEHEQELYLAWPLYRTIRGQAAFNAAMATLKATHGPAPKPAAFVACPQLHCRLNLPTIPRSGWLPPGRLWLSPDRYILIAHAPRRPPAFVRRRSPRTMRYFVFHEFHNSTGNVDTFDTVSSHNRRVFVPFYLSKTQSDALGRRFVVLVQVSPYDVRSIHASNRGSAGPGVEVAKNRYEALEPLQSHAGVLLAAMVKHRAPKLRVVHHRGSEGRPMLRAYMARLKALRLVVRTKRVTLPFTPAQPAIIATAKAGLRDLITPQGPLALALAITEEHSPAPSEDPPTNIIPPAPKLAKHLARPKETVARASLTAFLKALFAKRPKLVAPPKPARPPWCETTLAGLWDHRCRRR